MPLEAPVTTAIGLLPDAGVPRDSVMYGEIPGDRAA
jgi:hypothetical protein